MQSQSSWYLDTYGGACPDPAQQAYQQAVSVFRLDPRSKTKFDRLEQLRNLNELETLVSVAQLKYERQHENSKAGKWLSKLSSRICHYGRVLDVLVQHHPEYVSLAWGAMKFLFILVQNHEAKVKTLAKGLTRVADVLPRVQLASVLYPTARMKQAVSGLYSKIITFFLRAERWYQQGSLRHAWEAFSKPVELYDDDLLGEIREHTEEVQSLANAGAHAEQRDMHLEIQVLNERVQSSEMMLREIRGLLIAYQAVQTSANLDTNQRLTDLQLNQIMTFLTTATPLDPLKALQHRDFIVAHTIKRQGGPRPEQRFWADSRLREWEASASPSVVMVKGGYTSRIALQSFAISIIKMLRSHDIPVLWALPSPSEHGAFTASPIDLIKGLICQALKLNISQHTEKSLTLSCAQFRSVETVEQWLDLLARVVATLNQVYIVIDVESVGSCYSQGFSWLSHFLNMLERNALSKWTVRLKVLLIGYGPGTLQQPELAQFRTKVVSVRDSQSMGRVKPVASWHASPIALRKSGGRLRYR